SKDTTTIELVGSCSSLVAIRLLNNDSVISNRLKTTPGLARALRGAILLDTANMLPAAGKAKPQDEAALNLLESLDSKACGVVGLASLATSVAEFLRRSDAAKAIEEFSAEANCSILLLLGIEVLQQSNDAPPDGAVDIRRDLAIVCTRPACQLMTEKLVQYLLCEHQDPDLQLEELTIDCFQSGRLFTQHNLKASRKQILPAVLQFLNSIKENSAVSTVAYKPVRVFSMTAIDVLGQCPEKSTKTIAVNPYVQQQQQQGPQQAINRPISVQDKDQLQCHARVKHHQGTTGPIDPSNEAYFHGLMTPELAEERLLMMTSADDYSYEKPDGLFLLRSCLDGNFAVSALDSRSGSSVSHYPIVRAAETNGYRLASSRHSNGFDATFPGPVELIRGHPTMVKLARVPCPRPSGTSPLVLAQGVTADELTWSAGEDLLAGLHRGRPWYHEDCLDRAEAERRLASGGHVSGDFLVRQRRQQQVDDESSSSTPQRTSQSEFVLTLSWRREAWHYRILAWKSRPDWLAIEGANRGFRTLIELIDYYHLRRDGLMCRLRRPVTANAAAAAAEAAAELAKAESEVANDWEFLSGLE
uniref:SH2 domain-containing protein n=1 Tax=Macrostomum lignano TaxID=282301 RepID=A0A1I8IVY9_9PLAT